MKNIENQTVEFNKLREDVDYILRKLHELERSVYDIAVAHNKHTHEVFKKSDEEET